MCHTTNFGQKQIVVWHTTSLSCATRQVSWHFFSKWKKCRVPHDNFHDIFFQNKNSVVCQTTRSSCTKRHILLLRWKIRYLSHVHFSVLNCTRRLFSRTFSNFSNFLWCHPMWDGKLILCFEFQYSNSFGRWKFFVLCAFKYRTRPNIARSWFETALEY